jgi:hypothetical protein
MAEHFDLDGNGVAQDRADVSVAVQAQKSGIQVKVQASRLASLAGMEGGEFTPFRPVITLGLVNAQNTSEVLTRFDPAVEVRVRYTQQDLQRAGDRPLVLGFWDGGKWVKFGKGNKHTFRLEAIGQGQAGGFAVVEISDWTDPPCAWGS